MKGKGLSENIVKDVDLDTHRIDGHLFSVREPLFDARHVKYILRK